MSGDSQYLINLVELGLVGSLLFFLAILSPIFFLNDSIYRIIWISYLCALLIWGLNTELWLVSKGAQLFWLVSGILILLDKSTHNPLNASNNL